MLDGERDELGPGWPIVGAIALRPQSFHVEGEVLVERRASFVTVLAVLLQLTF